MDEKSQKRVVLKAPPPSNDDFVLSLSTQQPHNQTRVPSSNVCKTKRRSGLFLNLFPIKSAAPDHPDISLNPYSPEASGSLNPQPQTLNLKPLTTWQSVGGRPTSSWQSSCSCFLAEKWKHRMETTSRLGFRSFKGIGFRVLGFGRVD